MTCPFLYIIDETKLISESGDTPGLHLVESIILLELLKHLNAYYKQSRSDIKS